MNGKERTGGDNIVPFRDPYFPDNKSLLEEPDPLEVAEADAIWNLIAKNSSQVSKEALKDIEATWTTRDVARHVGRSVRTVRRWVKEGALLAIKLRGTSGYRYPHFQFSDLPRLGKRSILPEVTEIRHLLSVDGVDPFSQAEFFLSKSDRLDGLSPLEIIRRRRFAEKVEDVKFLAQRGYEGIEEY